MQYLKRFVLQTSVAVLFCGTAGITHAQLPPSPPPTNCLNSWSFEDVTNWTSDLGYPPTSFTNIFGDLHGDGTSLMVDSNNLAWLQFGGFNSDGTTNLSVGPAGSIFFWFSPDWASATTNNNGAGPGAFGRLLEVGAYSTNATYGWFSLFVDPGATNFFFCTQTNTGDGSVYTNLSVPIDWATNAWQFVALTYSATNLSLYTNGVLATNASGLAVYPGLDVLTNGFWIGSDSSGTLQMHGWMDDLYAYDYPLDSTTVSNIYHWFYDIYVILPYDNVMAESMIQSASSSASTNPPVFDAVTGSGYLQFVSNASSCVNSSNVWITNVSCTLVGSGTNQTADYTFTIMGGTNGLNYDVFGVNPLGPTAPIGTTNGATWSWMGQGQTCSIYTITNLPVGSAFFILGTPYDPDGDGLTWAYERLVSHTDPTKPDTSGDGMLDGWKVFWGLNPLLNNWSQSSLRLNYTYDGSGWLNQVSGVKSGSVSLDNEGNVLSVSE